MVKGKIARFLIICWITLVIILFCKKINRAIRCLYKYYAIDKELSLNNCSFNQLILYNHRLHRNIPIMLISHNANFSKFFHVFDWTHLFSQLNFMSLRLCISLSSGWLFCIIHLSTFPEWAYVFFLQIINYF